MRIFFPEMHNTVTRCLGLALNTLGHDLLVGDHSFNSSQGKCIKYGNKYTQQEADKHFNLPNVKTISVDQLLQEPPDVMFISCYEVQKDILTHFWPVLKYNKVTKLAHYSGNDNTPFVWSHVKNIIAADKSTYNRVKASGMNAIDYLPWVDYDSFKYNGEIGNRGLYSFIYNYEKLFKKSYTIFNHCVEAMKDICIVKNIDNVAKVETPGVMQQCSAGIHIKELEGYGYAVLELMASGRPVFLFKPYAKDKKLMDWSIEGETCFFFETLKELKTKYEQLMVSPEELNSVQLNCSKRIRELVNNQEQTSKLNNFLNNLI
ncbi:hypothetical protein OAU81_00475 [bacterium]|nr:hypothetical protein [bacterium]